MMYLRDNFTFINPIRQDHHFRFFHFGAGTATAAAADNSAAVASTTLSSNSLFSGISVSVVVVVVVGAVSVVSFISAEHNSDGTAQRADGTTNADVVAAAATMLRTTAENCIVIYNSI